MINHAESLYLKPGEIFYADTPMVVNTVLGSCVSITMYVRRLGIGMMSHCMLPSSTESIKRGEDIMKYVDCAVLYMNKTMLGAGADKKEIEVKLFGGSNMFTVTDEDAGIGSRNISASIALLKSLGYTITSSDTGGQFTRKLYFSLDTGTVYLRKISKIQGL
ncbi:chemotaxis protein CheD [Seleniivibrio sp.]|uniref:chemotaxis protein CheD n=1 Tax=Seleniivibrio sp. TaxID=2898801 RepID=UPI0025D63F51|nr:chemotaxis protein CheD [Seleniivibrio sp.]MCD8554479.1 chemotaxis protein CheD [Seleniivibrio sp.]